VPFASHWTIGGVFLIGVGAFVIGIILMLIWRAVAPAFFRGETLRRETPTLVCDEPPRTDLSVADRRAVPPDN
jgi:hypothetical protein